MMDSATATLQNGAYTFHFSVHHFTNIRFFFGGGGVNSKGVRRRIGKTISFFLLAKCLKIYDFYSVCISKFEKKCYTPPQHPPKIFIKNLRGV